MKRHHPTGADARPRVHIWPCNSWSLGPTGARFPAASPGRALDAALEKISGDAVVFLHTKEPTPEVDHA